MYIEKETITGNGTTTTFTLSNNFHLGSTLIRYIPEGYYSEYIFKDYREVSPNQIMFDNAPLATDQVNVSYFTKPYPKKYANACRYATPAQLKAYTNITALASLADSSVEPFIRRAEQLIDTYCTGWTQYYEYQELNFPRDIDTGEEYPIIPEKLTLACFQIIEQLYLKGTTTLLSSGGEIISEKIGNYSYNKKSDSSGKDIYNVIPVEIRAYLKPFKNQLGSITVGGSLPIERIHDVQ